MTTATILGTVLAACVATTATADQPARQFGNAVYTLPDGWITGRSEGGVITFLSDLPDDRCQFCYLYLSTSLTDGTDPLRAIARRGLRFVDEDDRAGAVAATKADTFRIGGRPGAMQAYKVGGDILMVLAVALPDRVEMLAFRGDGDEDDLPVSLDVLQTMVVPFAERLAFVSEGAAPLMPAPVPGDLDGVWWGWNNVTSLGMDMMMRTDMAFRTLIFWPDGRFFDGTPPDGLRPVDPAPLVDQGRTDFGVYARDGDTLTLTFASGETETLTAEGDGWTDGARTLNPIAVLPDGARLSGGVSSIYFSGFTPGSGVEGGISSSSETTFSPDGTYTGSSFGGAFGNFDRGGGYSVGNDSATGGTYVVRDGLLITTPTDGQPRAVLALQDEGTIILGDQFLDTD